MRELRYQQLLIFAVLLVALTAILVSLVQVASGATRADVYFVVVAVGVVAAAVAVYSLLRVNRIHPAVRRCYVVPLDVASIWRAAGEGKRFSMPLGTHSVEIIVEPEPAFGQGEIIEIRENGESVRRPIGTGVAYAGRVAGGDETNDVRLTFADDWLTGYVREGRDWWFIEPLKRFRAAADLTDYIVYRTADLRFTMDLSDDTLPKKVEQSLPDSPPDGTAYLPPQPTPPAPPSAHKVGPGIGIALVADREYDQQAKWTGASWYVQQIGVLNNVNGLYKNNIGCWFIPKVFLLTYKGLGNCKADLLLDDVESVVKQHLYDLRLVQVRQDSGVECAHLTSGKDLDGKTLGIAWQPGVYGLSQHQLVWLGGGGGWGGPPNLAFQNMMLMAHELGHNFSGDHGAADEWCVKHFLWCWDYERSLMWPTFYDDNNPWISDGTRNASHNNRQRMKDNMANQRDHNF